MPRPAREHNFRGAGVACNTGGRSLVGCTESAIECAPFKVLTDLENCSTRLLQAAEQQRQVQELFASLLDEYKPGGRPQARGLAIATGRRSDYDSLVTPLQWAHCFSEQCLAMTPGPDHKLYTQYSQRRYLDVIHSKRWCSFNCSVHSIKLKFAAACQAYWGQAVQQRHQPLVPYNPRSTLLICPLVKGPLKVEICWCTKRWSSMK